MLLWFRRFHFGSLLLFCCCSCVSRRLLVTYLVVCFLLLPVVCVFVCFFPCAPLVSPLLFLLFFSFLSAVLWFYDFCCVVVLVLCPFFCFCCWFVVSVCSAIATGMLLTAVDFRTCCWLVWCSIFFVLLRFLVCVGTFCFVLSWLLGPVVFLPLLVLSSVPCVFVLLCSLCRVLFWFAVFGCFCFCPGCGSLFS